MRLLLLPVFWVGGSGIGFWGDWFCGDWFWGVGFLMLGFGVIGFVVSGFLFGFLAGVRFIIVYLCFLVVDAACWFRFHCRVDAI